jgi:hypothetical protein
MNEGLGSTPSGEAAMAIRTVRCHISHAPVTVVTDFEGAVQRVICCEYTASSHACRLKDVAFSGGPLSQLVERLSDETLDSQSRRCDLLTS